MTWALNYDDNSFKPRTGFVARRVTQAGKEFVSSALRLSYSLGLHSLLARLPKGPPGTLKAGAEAQKLLGDSSL